jgi:hypothetical protein
MKALRLAAICSSLGLLFGCVWFTQKQSNPTMMPSSKVLVLPNTDRGKSPAIMPGSKSGTLIMPGSKSFTGPTIHAQSLQTSPSPQPPKP